MISTDGVYIGTIGICKLSIDIVDPLAIKGKIIFGNAHGGAHHFLLSTSLQSISVISVYKLQILLTTKKRVNGLQNVAHVHCYCTADRDTHQTG